MPTIATHHLDPNCRFRVNVPERTLVPFTPSKFYEEKDGKTALEQAEWVVRVVKPALK